MIMKKFISAILTVALIIGLLPCMTLTANAATEGVWAFTVSNGNATITNYTGSGGNVTIPSTLGGNPVTTIDRNAFWGCESLTSIIIPNSVTSIGDQAFINCTALTSVTIPNSVTSIGINTFKGCTALTSVTIPNSVTTISYGMFEGCASLVSVTIPNSVTSIGERAFLGCTSLTSVTIPDSVTSIGAGAFWDCTLLTSVTILSGVTEISQDTFRGTSLTSVIIPDGVTHIRGRAFYDCTLLRSITIPNSVTSIGSDAFINNHEDFTIYCYENSTAHGFAKELYGGIKFVLITGAATPPPPTQEIKVLVGGTAVTFDQPPIIENGRTLVPLRAIFEALGATVEWEQSTQTVTAVKDDITIILKIGDAFLTKNGERIALDVPAKIVGGRTLVPARAVAESFGADVQWDGTTRTVTITE